MHNHLASQTIRVLPLFVRMIPVRSSRVRNKCVGVRLSGLNRTLCDATRAVKELCVSLPDAMEMERRGLIRESVVDSDGQRITHIALDGGNGPFAVDPYDLA